MEGGSWCVWLAWQVRMKSCRKGFMRWRMREGPWGSHQEEARALKWATSEALTDEYVLEFVVVS